jgi:hypothetical protein
MVFKTLKSLSSITKSASLPMAILPLASEIPKLMAAFNDEIRLKSINDKSNQFEIFLNDH